MTPFPPRTIPTVLLRRGTRPAISTGFLPAPLLVVLLLLLGGCAASDQAHRPDSNLSDALDQAKREPKDQTPLPVDHDDDGRAMPVFVPTSGAEGERTDQAGEEREATTHPDESFQHHFGIVTGVGDNAGPGLEGFRSKGLQLGTYAGPRFRGDLAALYSTPILQGGGPGSTGMKRLYELSLDVSFRGYLTPNYTLIGPYGLLGARCGLLLWDYTNPIQIVDLGRGRRRTIRDDALSFKTLYLGVGLSPLQLSHVQVGANLCWGLRWFNAETGQGFDNNVFPATGYWQLMCELSLVGH